MICEAKYIVPVFPYWYFVVGTVAGLISLSILSEWVWNRRSRGTPEPKLAESELSKFDAPRRALQDAVAPVLCNIMEFLACYTLNACITMGEIMITPVETPKHRISIKLDNFGEDDCVEVIIPIAASIYYRSLLTPPQSALLSDALGELNYLIRSISEEDQRKLRDCENGLAGVRYDLSRFLISFSVKVKFSKVFATSSAKIVYEKCLMKELHKIRTIEKFMSTIKSLE